MNTIAQAVFFTLAFFCSLAFIISWVYIWAERPSRETAKYIATGSLLWLACLFIAIFAGITTSRNLAEEQCKIDKGSFVTWDNQMRWGCYDVNNPPNGFNVQINNN